MDDTDGFVDFVAARGAALRRTAYLLTGDWHAAEDVVQTSLVKLYLGWRRVRRDGSEAAYANKVVLRTFLDDRRRPWRRESSVSEVHEERGHGGGLDALDDRAALLAALGRLPAGMRAVVVCRYWEDMSVEQTADVLDISTGTVKSQSAKALARLRADIDVDVLVPANREDA